MKNEKSNEELQSRREFFKKATKSVLPILGMIAFSNVALLSKAADKAPMGCEYGCSLGCYTECYGCLHTCNRVCADSCNYNCVGGCKGACLSMAEN